MNAAGKSVVVIAGPTGSGESTITNEIIRRYPDRVRRIVTATTRAPRGDGDRKPWAPRGDGERKPWTPKPDGERRHLRTVQSDGDAAERTCRRVRLVSMVRIGKPRAQ